MFPLQRGRRLRVNESIRSLVRETTLSPSDFMFPMFIAEGENIKVAIPSMPGIYRRSIDLTVEEVKEIYALGIRAVNIYVKVSENLKDNAGVEAWNPNGLMQQAIRAIKTACPEMIVMPDVALDPYSIYGHDGIIENGDVANDATNEALVKMAVSHAQAGADFVAPSDMMDGRVLRLRQGLDAAGFQNVGIMSYSAKYASAFYGPFRDALDSAPREADVVVPKDKKTYQMDYANRIEAIKEALSDVEEGADMVMVKPGIAYLDIVREVKNAVNVPVTVLCNDQSCCRKGLARPRQNYDGTTYVYQKSGSKSDFDLFRQRSSNNFKINKNEKSTFIISHFGFCLLQKRE
jgi:porphobilinogen synthase